MTIFALASGSGRAAIAVMRLSGSSTKSILHSLAGAGAPPRRATLRTLRQDGEVLDHALVIWFPAPRSYTGEDSAELHLHGGRAVLQSVTHALVRLGARPAEPGEFTRRAFLNGRMDLLQAEAVADLVAAETEGQRRQAVRQLEGSLGALYRDWSDDLRRVLAWQEAQIDFSTEDLPDDVEQTILSEIAGLAETMASHLKAGARGEHLRDGLVFTISGPPNVGKSSLINALARRDAAIVSSRPGTTRDAIEVRLELAGIPVTLVDTAGLRHSDDEIEREGIRRALSRRETADLVIELREPGAQLPESGLAVLNKVDLINPNPALTNPAPITSAYVTPGLKSAGMSNLPGEAVAGWILISASTGEGLPALRARLEHEAINLAGLSSAPTLTRARHRVAIQQARSCLQKAASAQFADQRAEELRQAMRALGRITGEVGVEDLLDTVFSTFCIGK